MSQWNHPMCDWCWYRDYGERVPVRLKEPDKEVCCWCGRRTSSGIYVRADPVGVAKHHPHDVEPAQARKPTPKPSIPTGCH